MSMRITLVAVLALIGMGSVPAVAQDSGRLFCVRASRDVDADQLDRLVERGRVTIEVLPASECGPREVEAPRVATGGTPIATFTARATVTSLGMSERFATVSTAAEEFDLDTIERVMGELETMATDELAWLRANPPLACYADIHSDWADVMGTLQTAASTTIRGVRELDVDVMTEGANGIGEVGGMVSSLADRVNAVDC